MPRSSSSSAYEDSPYRRDWLLPARYIPWKPDVEQDNQLSKPGDWTISPAGSLVYLGQSGVWVCRNAVV